MQREGLNPQIESEYKDPIQEQAVDFDDDEDAGFEFEQSKDSAEIVENKTKQWADSWLEQVYNNPPAKGSIDGFRADHYLVSILDELTGGQSPDSFEDNRITPAYQTAVETFYTRVVDFAETKINSDEDQERTQLFLKNINKCFFSASGGTADHMSFLHHLLFTSKINRIPELQGWAGQKFTGEMVYKLSFCDAETVDNLIQEVKDCPVAQLVDVIEQLKAVGAHSLAQAYSEESGYDNTIKIIRALKESSRSPLVSYAADSALVRLGQEEENPSYSFITTHATKRDSRLPEKLSEQLAQNHKRLSKQIKADIPIYEGGVFAQISKDTVGILDHSNMLYAVGAIDVKALNTVAKIPPESIKNIKEFIRNIRTPNPTELRELLGVTIQNILEPRQDKKFIPVSDLPRLFYNIAPVIPEKEYRALFSEIVKAEKREDSILEQRWHSQKSAENTNEELTDKFLDVFENIAPTLALLQSSEWEWAGAEWSKYLEAKKRLAQSSGEGRDSIRDKDLVFGVAADFAERLRLILEYRKDDLPKIEELRGMMRDLVNAKINLHQYHAYSWDNLSKENNAGLNDSLKKEFGVYNIAMGNFAKHYKQFSQCLNTFLEKVEQEQEGDLKSVHFTRISQLVKDKHLMPFAASDTADMPILLADLHRPGLRVQVEQDLGISLTELTLATQIHFLRFLAGQNVEGYERLKAVLQQSEGFKTELLNSFLAVSENVSYGEGILTVAESVKTDVELAGIFFGRYNKFLESMNKTADYLCLVNKGIFTETDLTRQDVVPTLLTRANEMIREAAERLPDLSQKERTEAIKEIIANFDHQEKATAELLVHFRMASEDIRNELKKRSIAETGNIEDYIIRYEPDQFKLEMDEILAAMPEKERLLSQAAIQREGEMMPQRLTSDRIQTDRDLILEELENFDKHYQTMSSVDSASAERYKEYFIKNKPELEKKLRKLNRLLVLQKAFESSFQKLLNGGNEAALPKKFLASLEKEAQEIKPELMANAIRPYFPVGISKDMPNWKAAMEGQLKAAKPVDIYNYLFWLQNQNRPIELMVCDEIQASNYAELYGVSEAEARATALQIGQNEREFYNSVIEEFGLNNLHLKDYKTFKEEIGEDKINQYRKLCEGLAKNSLLRPAFLAMFQESVAGSGGDAEKFLSYALEEVSWVLARGGTKISHRNEAKYDVIAALVKNLEALAKREGLELAAIINDEKLVPILNTVVAGLQNTLTSNKGSSIEQKAYFDSAFESLKLVIGELRKQQKGPLVLKVEKFKPVFDFYCSSATSQSFGFRQKGDKGQTSVMKFREPYSTYFYKDGAEVFLNSDQVVASPDGLPAGKILALDSRVQQQYAEAVLKPLITNYFKVLQNLSTDSIYFINIGKTKEQLMSEASEESTVVGLLRFIQKYIVKPSLPQESTVELQQAEELAA